MEERGFLFVRIIFRRVRSFYIILDPDIEACCFSLHIFIMTQLISTTNTTLTYPLYVADFDPNNNNYLLVGGGGGEGRSGVGNKIVRETPATP